jgi:hypothetical protein
MSNEGETHQQDNPYSWVMSQVPTLVYLPIHVN